MVDIIIRAKNGHDMTAACIASIRENTPSPAYRIILVDDGSDPAYGPDGVDVLIRNAESKGAVTASNLGMAVAMQNLDVPYMAIFDNDTIVPDGDTGWLERFVAAIEEDPAIGCVGATTNYASGRQHVLAAPATYTADWSDGNGKGGTKQNPEVPVFVSFACLLRKQAMGVVGFWDTRFDPGNYEDTDYAMQLRTAGWKVKVAQSVYVIHHGHRTFSASLTTLLRVNGEKFARKWGIGRLFDHGIITRDEMRSVL